MDFTVEFYETEAGACPVREFLDDLKDSDPDDFAVVVAGLAKLRNSQYHREPLSKALGDGLFELRHIGKLNTRVLWSFMKADGSSCCTESVIKDRRSQRAISSRRGNGCAIGGKERNDEKNQFRSLCRSATAGSGVCCAFQTCRRGVGRGTANRRAASAGRVVPKRSGQTTQDLAATGQPP